MIIEITDGCTLAGMDIDGIPISEMSEEQRHEVRKTLCEYILNHEDVFSLFSLGSIIINYADSEYTFLGRCECCGDWIRNWKIEI
jgi:hypothetical protein